MAQFRRIVATALIVSITALALPQPAQAGMLSTGAALAAGDRDRIVNVMNRGEVRAQLQAYGVNVADLNARIAALTDEEAAQIARQVDSLPAGGDAGAVLGVALLVFLVLVITDLLGVTHIFPFIKPIR
jgi:hypothetical protein